MLTGFHHLTLNVTDLPRARAFYEGILGFEVVQDLPGRKLSLRVGTSRSRLVLHLPPGPVDADQFSEYRIGLDHVAFGAGRADLDKLAAALSATGITSDLHHDPVGPAVLSFRDRTTSSSNSSKTGPPGPRPSLRKLRADSLAAATGERNAADVKPYAARWNR